MQKPQHAEEPPHPLDIADGEGAKGAARDHEDCTFNFHDTGGGARQRGGARCVMSRTPFEKLEIDSGKARCGTFPAAAAAGVEAFTRCDPCCLRAAQWRKRVYQCERERK